MSDIALRPGWPHERDAVLRSRGSADEHTRTHRNGYRAAPKGHASAKRNTATDGDPPTNVDTVCATDLSADFEASSDSNRYRNVRTEVRRHPSRG